MASHSPSASAGQVAVAVAVPVLRLRERVVAPAAAVEQRHLVTAVEQGLHDVPADEAGAPDDEDAHGLTSDEDGRRTARPVAGARLGRAPDCAARVIWRHPTARCPHAPTAASVPAMRAWVGGGRVALGSVDGASDRGARAGASGGGAVARRRARTVVVTVLGVLVVVAAVAVPVALRMRQDRVGAAARAAVDGFARAWPTGTLAAVHYAGTPGATVATQVSALTAGLAPALGGAAPRPAAVDVVDVGDPADGVVHAQLKVRWALTGGRSWTYTTAVDARDGAGRLGRRLGADRRAPGADRRPPARRHPHHRPPRADPRRAAVRCSRASARSSMWGSNPAGTRTPPARPRPSPASWTSTPPRSPGRSRRPRRRPSCP